LIKKLRQILKITIVKKTTIREIKIIYKSKVVNCLKFKGLIKIVTGTKKTASPVKKSL